LAQRNNEIIQGIPPFEIFDEEDELPDEIIEEIEQETRKPNKRPPKPLPKVPPVHPKPAHNGRFGMLVTVGEQINQAIRSVKQVLKVCKMTNRFVRHFFALPTCVSG
jgi:hypothetical protein